MFEILSTIGLTASAAIVIGFLAYAMADTPRGRLTVAGVLTAWFALVVTIGASAALDPARGFGVPALGLTVGLPVAALVGVFFAFGSIRAAMLAAPLPALVAVNAIRILPGWLFVLLYAAGKLPAPFAPSAGWGDLFAGVAALPLAWSILRFGRRCRAARVCVERHRDRGSRRRSCAWRPIGAGSSSGLRRSADERHHDHPALARHSRIPGAEPDFHSCRHLHPVARTRLKARTLRLCGVALKASRSRRETATPGHTPRRRKLFGGRAPSDFRNGGAPPSQSARRRPSLRA